MQMLKVLLRERLQARDISIRAAAREIGISHTALLSALEGNGIDLGTVIGICKWMELMPASVLNSEAIGDDALAAQIAAISEAKPILARAFRDAIRKVLAEEIDPEVFREIVVYAAYRIGLANGRETL